MQKDFVIIFSFHLYSGISFGMLCSFPLSMCDHNVDFVFAGWENATHIFSLGVAVVVCLVRFLSFGTFFCYSVYCRNVASSIWFC